MVERPAWGTADEYRIKPEPTYKTQPGDLVIGTQASGNEVMGTFTVAGGTYYVNNLVGEYTCSSCKLHPKQLLIYKQADQIAEFRQQMKKMYKGTWCGD
ncbi:MAG: hypothetical protein GY943_01065 [Chloroflexi bacterium]|nr:hypothetical protein [Chloroflexota bacterium]